MLQETSKTIYSAKALAVLSIICAHVTPINPVFDDAHIISSALLNSYGTVGIGVFLFFAGYFFSRTDRLFKSFWMNKIKILIIPWFICGTVVYAYHFLHKGEDATINGWISWIIGNGTYLYYMTCVTILYFVCFPFRQSKISIYVFIFLSIINLIITNFTSLLSFVNPYLNPLNFASWFFVGSLCHCYGCLEQLIKLSKKYCVLFFVLWFSLICLFLYKKIPYSYFQLYYIPIEAFALFAILGFAEWLNGSVFVVDVGKQSFAIYLLHYPIAGIITFFSNKVDFWPLTLVRGIAVLCVMYAFINIAHRVFRSHLLLAFNLLTGAR